MNKLKNRINPNPATEIMVSSKVHVANVSFMLRPKYSLNIQNPASFTWEAIKLPEPVASRTRARLASVCPNKGITRPAVVRAATVADPKEIRNMAAIIQASKIGDNEVSLNNSAT